MPDNNNDQTNPNDDPTQTSGLNIDLSDPKIGDQTVEDYTSQQVTNPETPAGTEHVPITTEVQPDELLDPTLTDIQSPQAQVATGTQYTVTDQDTADLLNITPSTYEAFTTEGVEGEVTPGSLMRHQLEQLMDDVDSGHAPWADAAIRRANEAMLKRGVGASSIAGAAISQAVLEAAMPIAQHDADTFGKVNLQNIRNRQEAMLSNHAAQNAARQFNAKSEGELDAFMANLRDRVLRFNVEQKNEMERFNAEQTNSVQSFYDKMENETDKFIAQNKLLIAKSNAEWRRTLNLANTATENAVMQQNVQNRFNMSQQALADLWQRSRDVFNWANETSENAKDRAFKVALYSLQRNDYVADMEQEQKDAFYGAIGGLAADIIGGVANKWIESIF